MRIIGVELRLEYSDRMNGRVNKEIAIIQCHVDVEMKPDIYYSAAPMMNGTLHTDRGDIQINSFSFPEYFLHEMNTLVKTVQK